METGASGPHQAGPQAAHPQGPHLQGTQAQGVQSQGGQAPLTGPHPQVRAIAAGIVAREGGYVNDPADPGGPTQYGVTLHTLKRLGLDRDGNGLVDLADLRKLTRDDAVEIFLRHYFAAPRLDRLPQVLQPAVFDMQVNAGGQAVRILQRLLNETGARLAVDGLVGPLTIAAAQKACLHQPQAFADAYGIARRNYYYALADARPASRKFATTRAGGKGGWILRAEAFISTRYHLTLNQHRERVATWL